MLYKKLVLQAERPPSQRLFLSRILFACYGPYKSKKNLYIRLYGFAQFLCYCLLNQSKLSFTREVILKEEGYIFLICVLKNVFLI